MTVHPCGAPCRGKLITKVENFIITLDPFLKYQIGPLYEAMRIINGRLFGMAGRTLYRLLEWWHSSQARAASPLGLRVGNMVQHWRELP